MALRMRDACKRVIYWNPDSRPYASIKQGCIGDGFEGIDVVRKIKPILKEVDLVCFPDSRLSDFQFIFESMGIKVWGSREGEDLEQAREFFLKTLGKLGLDVPPHTVVVGLDALKEHLWDKEDQYVKISHWRGDMETTHWRNRKMDEGWMDWLAVNLGPLKREMRFLVFPKIETDLEFGGDTYCVDGKFPSLMLNGIEGKDKSYMSAVTERGDMPEQILEVFEAFSPMLRDYGYRNQITNEVRIKGDKSYFIDATQRGGMPSTASQHLLWRNFPEIVWAGANGELIDPEPDGQFSIETMITSSCGHDTWDTVEIPKELEPWCRFSNCLYYDGAYVFPPDEMRSKDLGWLCAIGDTPKETLQTIKGLADMLPDGLNADVESLASIIEEVDTAKEEGVPFTEAPMPEPAEVL